MKQLRRDALRSWDIGLLGFSLIFWAAFLLLYPMPNIPLNDEWAFFYSVQNLLHTGQLRISDAATPSLVFQILWGSLFAKAFGVGYGVLRFSTAVLAWIAGICLYRTFRAGSGFKSPAAATLLIFFNPLFFILTSSFMTDVPAMSLSLISLSFLWHGFQEDTSGIRYIVISSLAAGAAYCVRQNAMMIPVGATLWIWHRGRLNRKNAFALWSGPLAAFAAYQAWVHWFQGPTRSYIDSMQMLQVTLKTQPLAILRLAFRRVGQGVIYGGLAALPCAVAYWMDDPLSKIKALRRPWLPLSSILLLSLFLWSDGWLPYINHCNYLSPAGLGCFNIPGALERGLPLLGSSWTWKAASLLSVATTATIIMAWDGAVPSAVNSFFAVPLLLYFAAVLPYTAGFFDRYFLPLIPVWILYSAPIAGSRLRSRIALWSGIAIFIAFSWAGTLDELRANAAAWDLGVKATETGIEASRVWAGANWCWSHEFPLKREGRTDSVVVCRGPFDAMVVFGPPNQIPASQPLASTEFFSPLSLRNEHLYLISYAGRTPSPT